MQYWQPAIQQEFGPDLIAAAEALIIKPLREEYDRAVAELNARFS